MIHRFCLMISCLLILGCVENNKNEQVIEPNKFKDFFPKEENFEIVNMSILSPQKDWLICMNTSSLEKIRREIILNDEELCNFELCDYKFPDSDYTIQIYCDSKKRSLIKMNIDFLNGEGTIPRVFYFCEETKGNIEKFLPLFKKAVHKKMFFENNEEKKIIIDSLSLIDNISIDSVKSSIGFINYIEVKEN